MDWIQQFSQYPLVLLCLCLTFYWFGKFEGLSKRLEDLNIKTVEAINHNTQALNELKTLVGNLK